MVIPTYNRAELLALTLASVFAQQPLPREVIVVDDGSTDGTVDYLESVNVSVVRNEGGGWGPARARQEGFLRSSTEFVAFLDSDDLLLPGTLARLERALTEVPAAPFAFGRCLTAIKREGLWSGTGLMTVDPEEMENPLQSLYTRNFVPSVGTVIRAESLRRIGGYPTKTTYDEDHYFWLRLAQTGDPVFVPLLMAVYRVHPGNRHSPAAVARDVDAYLALAESDPRLAPVVPARLGVTFCNAFTDSISSGNWRDALGVLWRNLLCRRHKGEILRHARQHYEARQRWEDKGLRLWTDDDELRAWLSQY